MSTRKYETLTPAGKRVRIAQDVIAQLEAGRLRAKKGAYVELPTKEIQQKDLIGQEWQKILAESKAPCEVCALGAIFASKVGIEDQLQVKSSDIMRASWWDNEKAASLICDRDSIEDFARDLFSHAQMELIEHAFEGWIKGKGATPNLDDDGEEEDGSLARNAAAGAWGRKQSRSPRKRMIAIMENIIENRGTFRPE